MKRFIKLSVFLITVSSLSVLAQVPQLVKDINTKNTDGHSYPIGNIGTVFFYAFDDGIHGVEIWRSDGTNAGTYLLKDINIGGNSSMYGDPKDGWGNTYAVTINNVLYFPANDGIHSWEIWRSDGTTAGTYLLKDINPSVTLTPPTYLTKVGNTLFFAANDDALGTELWKSDGTTAGTVMVKDIYTGSGTGIDLSSMVDFGGNLYFVANDGTTGFDALWKSNGTTAGTVLVKDLSSTYQYSSQAIKNLTVVNSTLYFSGYDNTNGRELWKSDGTTLGTVMVKDINAGSADGVSTIYPWFLNVNGTLFFTGEDDNNGLELWKSDGTSGGTVMIKDINTTAYEGSFPSDFQIINSNTLVFMAYTPGNLYELWKSDGTEVGTTLIADISSTSCCFNFSSFQSFVTTGTQIFFTGQNVENNIELWKTDGNNTSVIKDINVGSVGSFPQLYNASGSVFLFANNGIIGRELWKTNGTEAGTVLIKEAFLGTANSNPISYTFTNNMLFFLADDGVHGFELWKSDGTGANTQLVKDINIGSTSAFSSYIPGNNVDKIVALNTNVYFRADDGLGNLGVWKSDGTTAGTTLVKAFPNMDNDFVVMNGYLYFFIDDNITGLRELWKSDGTTAGTVKVKQVYIEGSNDITYLVIGNTLYFSVYDYTLDVRGLWKSDGTTAGTVLIKNFNDFGPYQFVNLNGTLYFVANDGTTGFELWKSDGTTAGTVLVKDIYVGGAKFNHKRAYGNEWLSLFYSRK